MNKSGTKNGAPSPNLFFIQYSSHLLSLCIEKAHSCPLARRSPETSEVQNKTKRDTNRKQSRTPKQWPSKGLRGTPRRIRWALCGGSGPHWGAGFRILLNCFLKSNTKHNLNSSSPGPGPGLGPGPAWTRARLGGLGLGQVSASATQGSSRPKVWNNYEQSAGRATKRMKKY